jgi:FHS family L-fucose permease-like MFS transporter
MIILIFDLNYFLVNKYLHYFEAQNQPNMIVSIDEQLNSSTKEKMIPTNYGALGTLVTVFFFWGFIAAGNSVFIPFCKHKFNLDQFQSQLVDTAFYFAYFVGALILFAVGALKGSDPVAKWGYKKGIVYGLLFSAFGAAISRLSNQTSSF